MKKTMLVSAWVVLGLTAFAQKPVAGDKTAEVVLNFQTGTAPVNYRLGNGNMLGEPELRFRYFKNDDLAFRVRLGLGMTSDKTEVSGNGPAPVFSEIKTNTGFNVVIAPGIEKHLTGTGKLSPYVGVELPFVYGTGASRKVTNASVPNPVPALVVTGDAYERNDGSRMSIGLNAVIGADYYFTEGIYLGIEIGSGILSMTSQKEGETTITNGLGTNTTFTGKSSAMNLFGAYAGGLRLGFKF